MKHGIAVLALVIPAALIVGCGPSAEEKTIGLVKTDVISRFKDPDSVQYRDVKSVKDRSAWKWYVCGEVNAKNGFGAYVGYDRFYGIVEGQGAAQK